MIGAKSLGELVVALRVRVGAARDEGAQAFAEFARQVEGRPGGRLHVTAALGMRPHLHRLTVMTESTAGQAVPRAVH